MKEKEILRKIDEILNNIQVKTEKLESFNVLINDKLEDIQSYKHDEVTLELYNARRNIGSYKLLSYSISDKVREINEDIENIYNLLDFLKNNNESEENYGK